MATGSGAFGVNGGYNQSGGGYLVVVTDIAHTKLNVFTPGSGSGGATQVGTLAIATATDLPGATSTLFLAGKIIRDMGKTLVSSGRTFRKIQAVASGNTSAIASLGVVGLAPTATNVGYASFYLETGREGSNGATALPAVARFM
jgi:hypothetical protein